MSARALALAAGIGFLWMQTPVSAHHSVAAAWDVSRTVTFKGTICAVDWTNPHSHVYVHVKMDNGDTETWKVELPSPNQLTSAGVTRDVLKNSLKAGDTVAIEAYPTRQVAVPQTSPSLITASCPTLPANVIRSARANDFTLPSGKRMSVGAGN